MPLNSEDSKTHVLSFQWQDTTIYLELMLLPEGKKFLYVNLDGVATAGLTSDGIMDTSTTSEAAEDRNAAGATTTPAAISDGFVPFATVKDILIPNSEG